jgi:hypothetical protein
MARPGRPLIAAIILLALTSGCGSHTSGRTVTVDVAIAACAGGDCLQLPLPNATVQVLSGNTTVLASGTTDNMGQCRLTVTQGGQDHIVVKSAFIKNGSKDVPITIQEAGSGTDVTVLAPMSAETFPAPS